MAETLAPNMLEDDVVVIRPAQREWEPLPPQARYDITRGVWHNRRKYCEPAKLALAIYQGIVKEIYTIARWFNASETYNEYLGDISEKRLTHVEFVGNIAPGCNCKSLPWQAP